MKRYDLYKDSGIEWVGKYPVDWKLMTVRRVTDIHKQGFYSTDSYKTNGYRLVRITDLDANGNIDISNSPFVHPTDKELEVFDIKKGDILFPRTGSIGLVGVAKEDLKAVFASYLIRFRFLETTFNSYMRYYFISDVFINGLFSDLHGGVNQNIHAENIKDQYLVLPTLEEQTQIANYLDHKTTQIDDLISKKEKLIELLKEERIAIINQAVTKGLDPNIPMKDSGIEWLGEIPEHWEFGKLKYFAKTISKGTTPSTVGRDILEEGPVRYLKAENIFNNELQSSPSFYIDNDTDEILKRSKLLPDDVLIVIAGATIGKVAIVDKEYSPSNTNQAVCFIRLNDCNKSRFLWYWLRTHYIKEKIQLDATQAAQPNLSMESIGNFGFPMINKEETRSIIDFIDRGTNKLKKIQTKVEKEIQLLKEYKTALISEVVTGKVDVRNEVID